MSSTEHAPLEDLRELVADTARDILENEPRTYLTSRDFARRLDISRAQAARAITSLRDDPDAAFTVVDERPGARSLRRFKIVFEDGEGQA